MRCCVPDCKSDTRHTSKSQGITFHTFPKSPSIREAWLRALNKESWVPKEHSSICSIHFMAKDLYFTKSGLRKVRESAVPVIGETQKEDFANGSDLDVFSNNMVQACRMCLATDQRLYSIRLYYLEQPFERFTGLSVHSNEKLPQYICSECYHKLINADNFRRKSLRANELLIESLGKHHVLTTDIIKSIDRHQLTSNLTIKHFPPDTYNIEIEHQYIEYDPNMEYVKPDIDMTVHVEKIEPLDIRDDIFADDIKDYDEAMTGDDAISKEEKEFDTDDSLPLEVTRKKKKSKINKKLREKPTAPKIDRRRKPFLNQDLNETLFTVTNLTFEEQVAEIEKRQESDNYKHSVFKCTECYKGFLDQDAYSSHMTRHTSECGEHQCDICKTHFKQSHALRKHITAHHTQRFSCNQCTYVTTHRQTARLHERWHKGTKYKCPHCQDEFVKFTTYMGHVRIKHPSDFVCELCGYSFVSAKGIELHKKLKHRTENGPVPPDGPYCSECNVRFASVEAHRKHLAVSARHSVIEGREPNKANKGRRGHVRDKVSKKISDQDDSRPYPSHLRRAEGPIPCEQCGMQLEDSRAYHGHFRRAHPDKNRTNYPSMKTPCMCELCGRIFQSAALLKDHRWTHTGERPFKCSICDKSFRMRQRLVAHRRVHQPDKDTYMCSVCGKHFSTHSNRQRHMFIHTGLKPFKCEMCGKCFKHASEKRAHVTYVHLKKPWPKRSRGKRGGRQGSPLPQDGGTDEIVMDSVWPTCDPKLDINVMNEKSMYYNMKI